MNIKKLLTMLAASVILVSCNGNKKPQITHNTEPQIPVSGTVKSGYRYLDMGVSGEPVELTVFRGDYIKFNINDQGDPQSEYRLQIPKMEINTVLDETLTEQPHFKMKQVGDYKFRIGKKDGTIRVVELKQANYSEVTGEDAWKMLHKDPPFLLDVRTKSEYRQGYIKGAVLIPLQEIQKRATELDRYKNQPILIYCATGNRSTTASKILLDAGFKNVMNLRNGIVGWGSKGYDIQFQ